MKVDRARFLEFLNDWPFGNIMSDGPGVKVDSQAHPQINI
jgi:hypothetical protein